MRWRRRLLRRQRKNGNSPKRQTRKERIRSAMARAFAATPRELGQAAVRVHARTTARARAAFALPIDPRR